MFAYRRGHALRGHAACFGESRGQLHELATDPMEAAANGYSEGIALDEAGYVSEGSGENILGYVMARC